MTRAVALLVVSAAAALAGPEFCASCHEIRPKVEEWKNSSHRNVECTSCHEYNMMKNARRAMLHVKDDVPEQPHIGTKDIDALVDRCKTCHQQQYAEWKAGPHSATYARIFTNADHNKKRKLMDDCFRCHGMHFEGSMRDMVQPVDTKGPWKIAAKDMENKPAIPCMACHSIHHTGQPSMKPEQRDGRKQATMKSTVALFDRRSRSSVPAALLPIPMMFDGHPVKTSPDQRQGLCYQCHAPLAGNTVGSGDDRTPTGVHEGLSCFVCHQGHQQNTRASCSTCHPRLSNCGIDVEKMDTTFANTKSAHNIHTVKCADCHPKGVPQRKNGLR